MIIGSTGGADYAQPNAVSWTPAKTLADFGNSWFIDGSAIAGAHIFAGIQLNTRSLGDREQVFDDHLSRDTDTQSRVGQMEPLFFC